MKSNMKVTPLPLNIYKMCLTWAGRDYFVWESSQAGECVSGGGSPAAPQSNPWPSSTPTTSSSPTTTHTLSSTRWPQEQINRTKSPTFHNIDTFRNGFSSVKTGPKVCVSVEEEQFQDGVAIWSLPQPSGQLSFSSSRLSLMEREDVERGCWGQKWGGKTLCSDVSRNWIGIVWRVRRTRINTFLPHMRTPLTAACHSFRATNFKD